MDDDDDTGSILQQQRLYYNGVHAGPPMYPHGNDPRAVPQQRQRRRKGKRKSTPEALDKDSAKKTEATAGEDLRMMEELKKAAGEFKESEKALPASDLPEGFPEDLAFRALAVYATLRTLSIQLRLSPFTPHAFLRALYLPYPNRLLGSVHVHILRILLSNLKLGYHWKDPSATPTFEVLKKRKIDGIKWPLRAGDNFYYLDMDTWPLFYDDYCHLTADILYASIFDKRSHIDWRALNLHDIVDQVPYLDDLVDEEIVDSDEDYVFQDEEVEEELVSDGDSSFERPKKKQKNKPKAKKKKPVTKKGHKQQDTSSALAIAMQNNRQKQIDAILSNNIRAAHGKTPYGPMLQQEPQSALHRSLLPKGLHQNYIVQNYERLHLLYRNRENVSRPATGMPLDRQQLYPGYVPRNFGSRMQHSFSPRNHNRNADFVTIRDGAGNLHQAAVSDIRTPVVAPRMASAPLTLPSSSARSQTGQPHPILEPANRNMASAPMQSIPTAAQNFAPHYGGPVNHVYARHTGNMMQWPPQRGREYDAHTQQGNLEPNSFYGNSRPEEVVRHDGEGSLSFWAQIPIDELEPNPVAEAMPSEEFSHKAEDLTLMNDAQKVVVPRTSASYVQPEVGHSNPGTLAPFFGTNDNPIEILDNDFDDEIVSYPLDGVTWEVKGEPLETDKNGPDTSKESKSQASITLPSVELSSCCVNAAEGNIPGDCGHHVHDGKVFDEKSLSAVTLSTESGLVGLDRKRKHRRLDPECKDAFEPAHPIYADTSSFLSPKYYDVECIPRHLIPEVLDLDTKKPPGTQHQLPIQQENKVLPLPGTKVASQATFCEDSQGDHVVLLAHEIRDSHLAPSLQSSFTDNRNVAVSTTEIVASGPPLVSGPDAPVRVSLQPSSDDRTTLLVSTVKDHVVASSNTSAFPNKTVPNNGADFVVSPQGLGFPMGLNPAKVLERNIKQKPSSSFAADSAASSKRSLVDALQAFIRGKRPSDALNIENVDKAAVDKSDDVSLFEVFEPDHWSHFNPLMALRRGIPYHRLSVVDKLVMLEYLVDELLSVDWIAAVFSDRYSKLSRSDYLYGSKPSAANIQALRDADGDDHDDLCAVCKESGDVVCCDGCVSVYHKGCVGLSKSCDPPDIWYCPECEFNDPSSFGPLRGGQKSEVDWVFIGDFFVSSHIPTLDERRRQLFESKLLAVHGFVFCHNATNSQSPLLRNDRCLKPPTQPVLSAKRLHEILHPLGQQFSSKWPIKQVPVNASVMWSTDDIGGNHENYFKKRESYDPSHYKNLYFDAPVLLESIQRSKHLLAVERNVFSNDVEATSKLSDFMSPEMAKDGHLVKILQSATSVFDAQQVVKNSLLKMERDLQKASLLDELWAAREQKSQKMWKEAVKHCATVRRLARLLLELVDATHVRAFKGGWTHAAVVRTKGVEGKRLRESDFKKDTSSVQEEALRRDWERCKLNHWTLLVAKSSTFIPGFKKAISVFKTSTKRKGIDRGPKQSSSIVDSANRNAAGDSLMKTNVFMENDDSASGEEFLVTVDKLRNRKRLDDFTFPISVSSFNISPSLGCQMREKMTSLSREAKLLVLREVRWPCAGKKLFDPVGYLPPSVVRHLGRTGGALFAPFVEYFSLHEVGQVAYFHVWRKRLLQCLSYEDLIKHFRIVESYLDQATIRQATHFSNLFRPGGGNQNNGRRILFTQRDLLTGLDFHLVEGGGDRPRWVSCLEIDLQALVIERRSRINRHFRKKDLNDKNPATASDPKARPGKPGESSRASSSSGPEMQVIMKRASRVVADHIIEMNRLLLQYGKESIPKTELTNLRKISDERLQMIFVGKYSYIGKPQRSEMITKAELSVYEKNPGQKLPTPNSTETVTSVSRQTEGGAEPSEKPAAISNSEGTRGAESFKTPTNAGHLVDSATDSLGPVAINQMIKGTPIDWSKQIIARHKEFTRSVYNRYDCKFLPPHEMESSRQQCMKDLLEIFVASGIKYSEVQTSALIRESENEVLRDGRNGTIDYYRNSLPSNGNEEQDPFHAISYRDDHCSFQSQVQQGHRVQALNTATKLDDGYGNSTVPVNACFASRLTLNGESWQEQARASFLHSQGQAPQATSFFAPGHYASSDGFVAQQQPSSMQYLPGIHPEQFQQNSAAEATQHMRSSSASNYGNMTGNEMLLTQQWQQQAPPLLSSMFNNQLQQNGAQPQNSSFMSSGQYSRNTYNGANGKWFHP